MKSFYRTYFLALILFFSLYSFAQKSLDKPKSIKAIACIKKDSIILRWGPTHYIAWDNARKNGYVVERYTMVKDGKVIAKPLKITLTTNPLKPKLLADWETAYKRNEDKYIAIASQAMFGADFTVTPKAGNMFQAINKAKEQENRFGFTMFAADQSTEVAELMALRFVDKNIKKGEKYLYRIYSPVTVAGLKIDTGNVFVDTDRLSEFPLPMDIKSNFNNKRVLLTWDNRFFRSFYSGWFIERSTDNKVWERRNTDPFISIYEADKPNDNISFMDSLPANNQIFYYRIIGRSYFGEISKPSKAVKGQGRTPIGTSPAITSIQLIDKNKLQVRWEMPEIENVNVREFRLYRAPKAKGPYKIIKQAKATEREMIITNPEGVNYFQISALGVDSNDYRSFSTLYQLKDETPPLPPTNVKGTIDSNGVVKLTWKNNKESDLYGYKVFRANRLHEEFSNMTRKIKKDTVYSDTLPLQNLSEKMYYKVVALDNHFNPSAFSTVFELRKPDKIGPSPAVFTKIQATDTSITLGWVNSSSTDVVAHVLYRTIAGADEWKLITRFDTLISKVNQSGSYVDMDKTMDKKLFYQYKLVSIDDAKNESQNSPVIKTKLIDKGIRAPIKSISYELSRENKEINLKWEYPQEGVEKILVYRKEKDEPIRLYTAVVAGINSFSDKSLKINTKYTYQLKAKHKDGGSSPFSSEIVVDF